jgi:hypothetical protein
VRPPVPLARREALAALAALLFGCGGKGAEVPPKDEPEPPLHLAPLADLAQAAQLVWLVELAPRAIAQDPSLIEPVNLLVTEPRFQRFAAMNGGVDLRSLEEIVVGGYPDATLALGRGLFDPGRVERAFADRAASVEGRAVDRSWGVTRVWGAVGGRREQLALFGRRGVGLERRGESGTVDASRPGPLRVAELFAEGRLRRAVPALRAEPLARAAEVVGGGPARLFAPGPFEGEVGKGLGGLLRAATALAVAARPSAGLAGQARVDVRVAVLGSWGDDAPAASARLAAAFNVLAEDPLGHLCGLDRPLAGPRVGAQPDALTLDAAFDFGIVARGLRDATSARLDEILQG